MKHRSSIAPIHLFESQNSPKNSQGSAPSEWFEVASPQLRKTSVMRKTIILPNGMTLDEQLNLILAKPERTQAEANILYEAIKEFPIIKMIFNQQGEKTFDMESILYLIRRIKLTKLAAGDIVYSQDDQSTGQLYVVYSGEIALCIKDPDHITTQNYERFEHEQKKRTMGKIGSSRKLNVNLKKVQSNHLAQNSPRSHRTPRQGETPEPDQDSSEMKEHGGTDDHVFTLLKSYMTDNYIPQQKVVLPEKLGQEVENDVTTMSGITKAFVKFKKVLKNRSTMLNAAKNYGLIRDKLSIGAFFGTTIDLGQRRREETAFALRDTELLVIEYKDLHHMKASFTKRRIALKNFMFDNFPKLDLYQSEKIVSGLLGTLEEKTFESGTCIINEGQSGEHFYILQSGTCEISKEIIIDEGHALDNKLPHSRALLRVHPSVKKKIALTNLSQGIFFGDELVFQAQKYFFTVKVTSGQANLVAINIRTFAARFPRVVFDNIKGLYMAKIQHYLEILRNHLMSAQYENYEIASELSSLSLGDKKLVVDQLNVKDLWNPIRMKPKKKFGNAVGSPTMTPGHKPKEGFLSPSNIAGNKSPLLKEFKADPWSQNNSPGGKEARNMMESRENLKNLIGPISPFQSTDKKPKNWSALNLQMPSEVKVMKIVGGNLSQNDPSPQHAFDVGKNDEEMDRIRKSYKTRTAVQADSPLLKHINIQGKDGISYINSHKAPLKGPLDFKDMDEIDPKMNQPVNHNMTALETLKLGIKIDKEQKKQATTRRKEGKFKSTGGDEEVGSTQRDFLPLLSGSPKRLRKGSDGMFEDPGFRTSPIPVKLSKETLVAAKQHEIEVPTVFQSGGFIRNRSMPDTTKVIGREVNIMDVPTPKETAEYIAKKKHLKIKEKILIEIDPSKRLIDERPSGLNKNSAASASFNKNEALTSSYRPAPGPYKDIIDLMIKGGSPTEINKSTGLKLGAVSKYDSVMDGHKSRDDLKKTHLVQWQDSQSIMLKEKGKIHQQLRRKPLAKSFFQVKSINDLELKNSATKASLNK